MLQFSVHQSEANGFITVYPKSTKIQIRVRHVPTHVGVHGNEKADRLAKAAARRAHLAAAGTEEQ